MKKNKHFLAIVLFVAAFFTATNKIAAQTCNQVEILYTAPDCFERDSHDIGGAGGQGKGCKEISVCVDQPYTYTSSITLPGWTFNWTVSGPTAVTINPNNTSPSVSIVWPQVGVYTLTLTATDPSGNIFTFCLKINVKDKPVANFTFAPTTACSGTPITFTGATTYSGSFMSSWNFGDPSSGSANYATVNGNMPPVTHTYASPGTYTVTLITYSFVTVGGSSPPNPNEPPSIKTCCADTITKQVVIKPGTLTINCISTVCPGDTVKYTAVGCTPTWQPTIGGTTIASTATTITIVWGNGNPQGQIVATCPGGCIASVPVPIIPTNPIIIGNTSPCNTSTTSYSLPVLPGTFYTWTLYNNSDNNFYNNLLNTYPDNNTVWINWAAAPAGTYTLTVNLDNKHICCSSTGTLSITPSGKWTAMMDQTICTGPPGANLFTAPGPGTFSWTILPPLMGASPPSFTGPTFNPVFPNPGTYTVQVIETANTYCNSGIANPQQIKVTVLPTMPPGNILPNPSTGCVGSQYTYTMSTPAPTGYHYAWSITMGAGLFQPLNLPTATGNTATILWSALPATISVVLQANGFPSCPSAPVTLTVNPATVGSITGTMNVCVDGTGTYTLTGGNLPSGETITWSIAPPNTSLGTIISGQGTNTITILWHGQPSGGPWGPVTINASTGCGNATALTGVMVYPKFSVSITKTGTDICNGGVNLTCNGAPPGSAYLWSSGQTTSSISGILTAGSYTVTATNPPPTGGGGCVATATYQVEDPFAIIPVTCGVGTCNGTATNEQLGVIVVKPSVGPFTYQWYNGFYPGTPIGGAITPNYTTPSHGNYSVVVTYGTCTRYLNFTVKKVCCPDVNNPQITSIVRNSCNSFTFTGTTPNPTGATIEWNFGNGVTMPGASGVPLTYVYPPGTIPGDYCVTFCVGPPSPNPTNCTGNCASRTVRIPLLAAFSYQLGCNGCLAITNLTQIAPTSGAATATYSWNFGDGSPVVTTPSATPPAHCYTIANTYTITLTVNYSDPSIGLTCSSAATQSVTWAPLAITVNPSPVCTGVQTQFSITGSPSYTIVSTTWNFGDGFTAYTPSSTHIYNSSAPFTVTLTIVDALGNTCTATKNINVEAGIGPCTIQPGYICPGGSVTLTAPNIAGATYAWEIQSGPNWVPAPGANTGMTYTTTTVGFYHVVITGPAPGYCKCTSNKVEVKAVAKPKALVAAAPSSKLCGPGSVTLSSPNHLPGYTSEWWNASFSTMFASGMMFMTPTISSTTTINLILINEYGCADTCSFVITVNPIPPAPSITASPTLCEGVPITLTEAPYTSNISWNIGATTPVVTVVSAGTYTVTYTNPTTGCSSSSSITIKRRPPTDLFPHFCDSIPCTCRDSLGNFTIYAPKPLIGAFASNYNIQWYLNGSAVGTNGPNPTYTPAQTGTYHIVVTDPITGCKDTSATYSIVVPKCDTCDCKESKWGDIILTEGNNVPGKDAKANIGNVGVGGNPQKLKCKSNYVLKCNQPYTFTASYLCKDTVNCPPKVTYSLQPPVGMPQTGNVAFSYTFTVNGVYILTLYGWCGNKICDSCVIDLTVNCEPLCDCKGSKWGEKFYSVNNVSKPLNCMKPADKPIDVKCNDQVTINANYTCVGNNCPGTVSYTLNAPYGTSTGNIPSPLVFTAYQTGTYTVTLYGWCGTTKCDSCIIRFKTICDTSISNCCPYKITVDTTKITTTYNQQYNATVLTENFTISGLAGVPLTEVRADVLSYTITDNYNKECMKCVNLPYTWASVQSAGNLGVPSVPPKITMYNTTVHPFNPTGTGVYQNPREVVWNNGSTFMISNGSQVGMNFLLPPPPAIDCCEFKGKICVRFTFRDEQCKECVVIACFEFVIKSKKPF